jgi:hypothetical protein
MRRETQRDKVVAQLEENGQVDNFWAIHNYILRLGAIIHDLKNDGWEFDGDYGVGKNKKNYIYKLVSRPEKTLFD